MLIFASWGVKGSDKEDPLRIIIAFADGLAKGLVVRIGWVRIDVAHQHDGHTRLVRVEDAKSTARWFRSKASTQHSELLIAVLHAAAAQFGLCGCVGARIGRAASSLEGIVECTHTFLWWWCTDRPEEYWYF